MDEMSLFFMSKRIYGTESNYKKVSYKIIKSIQRSPSNSYFPSLVLDNSLKMEYRALMRLLTPLTYLLMHLTTVGYSG